MRESLGENEGPRGWFLLVQTHFTLAELLASAEIERNSMFRGLVVELIRCITITFEQILLLFRYALQSYKYIHWYLLHYFRIERHR